MIGAKTVTSALLVIAGGAAAWLLLSPARLAGLDATTLFWVGLWASAAGPLVVQFWGMQRRSRNGFIYSYGEETWEDEADFLRMGPHRIAIVENEGEALDLPAAAQYVIIIGLVFIVGLLTIDSRAIAIVAELPSQLTTAGSDFCPDPDEETAVEETETPGCALLRRAYELGYAEDLGPCEPEDNEDETGFCTLRHRDEPWLHYEWRLLDRFWADLRESAGGSYFAELRQTFFDNADELDTLVAAQRHVMGTGPRASHHIWTTLPHPGDWLHTTTGDTFDPGRCVERFRSMPHRPHLEGTAAPASVVFEHVLGKLMFEPRYAIPAGYCKEYTVHWGAHADTCERLTQEPEDVLRDSGALSDVREVLQRYDLTARLRETDGGASARTDRARPAQRYVSFACFVEEERERPVRTSRSVTIDGHRFDAVELRVAPLAHPESQIERYSQIAGLLARGFHYGGLMSEASVIPGAESESFERRLDGREFALARLEVLADLDIFLGHDWILEREDLSALYPYHLHLKNFVETFRRQYRVQKGRL